VKVVKPGEERSSREQINLLDATAAPKAGDVGIGP